MVKYGSEVDDSQEAHERRVVWISDLCSKRLFNFTYSQMGRVECRARCRPLRAWRGLSVALLEKADGTRRDEFAADCVHRHFDLLAPPIHVRPYSSWNRTMSSSPRYGPH